jgi:hypothetical protein
MHYLLSPITYTEKCPPRVISRTDEFVPRIKRTPADNYESISCTFVLIRHKAKHPYMFKAVEISGVMPV